MAKPAWTHEYTQVNGIRLHYVRQGTGPPLILLHGWPEFWYTWRKNIGPLAERFTVIAPDLRGFGESEKPSGDALAAYTLEHHVEDLRALTAGLGLGRFGIVSHDVGAYVAQAFAQVYPESLTGLFFFNCPYPGIGSRWAAPDHLREIWYQSFQQLPWAAELVGQSRASCTLYFRHFLSHWAHDPHAFDDDLEAWVDNFLRPGNLQGGFNWYRAAHAARLAVLRGESPALPPIDLPTRIRWGASDPVLKVDWADRLGEYFSNLDFAPVPAAGHFVHYEHSELANQEIIEFFRSLSWPALGS